MILSVFTDGGSRGNPGISGCGVVIKNDDQIIFQKGRFLGVGTNNEAEYQGLITALEYLVSNPTTVEKINIFMDSQLVVRQIQGIYKLKSPNLIPLNHQVSELLSQLTVPYEFTDVRREFNSLADQLANQAMDSRSDV